MNTIYGLLFSLLVCAVYSAPLSNTEKSNSDAEALSKLIADLRKNLQTYSTPSPPEALKIKPPRSRDSQSESVPLPRKRNCAINFSNDCGTWETAYMNGAKNFFGAKRRIDDSTGMVRRVSPSLGFNAREIPREYIRDESELRMEPTKEPVSETKILQYLISLQTQLDIERNQNDKLCIQLTGQSCDQIWAK